MSKPIHTHGPLTACLSLFNRECTGFHLTASPHGSLRPIAECNDPLTKAERKFTDNEIRANARLLAAAYNAFDSAAKRLGVNAVELAERMQDAEIAALLDNLERCAFLLRRIAEGDHHALENALKAADSAHLLIAKVKGGAT
jgi:hypothetical protein